MYLPRYTYKISNNFLDYEFISVGPQGAFKKVVRFTQISTCIYNLAFGDLNAETGEINDISVTNNSDSQKVLATIASIVHDFTFQFPNGWIFAKGSTVSRTRLYRMGIANNWEDISVKFEVFGLTETYWEAFEKRKNYDAFLVRRKYL